MQSEMVKTDGKLQTISTYIMARKDALAQVIANGLSPERLVKIICAAASRSPRLLECTPASIYSCLHTSAQLGLELGGPLKHAHAVPFRNNKTGQMECTLVVGYEGYIDLARRTGQVQTIYAEAVREGDKFEYELGLHRDIKHKRGGKFDPSGKNVIAAYAVAHLKDGGYQLCVMMRDEIDAIRQRSKAKDNGPWVTDFEEMSKKTPIRRLQKYLPKSVEMAQALIEDDSESDAETTSSVRASIEPSDTGLELPAAAPDPLKERLKNAAPVTAAVSAPEPQSETPQKVSRRRKTAEPVASIDPEPEPQPEQYEEEHQKENKVAPVNMDKPNPEDLSLYLGHIINISAKMTGGVYKYTMDDNSIFYSAGDEFCKAMHKHREEKTKLELGYIHDDKNDRDIIREARPATA